MSEERRNLAWHRKAVSRIVTFNARQTDQAFAGATANDQYGIIDSAINEAAREERTYIFNNSGTEPLRRVQSLTWSADDATLTLPNIYDPNDVIAITDITNDAVGQPIFVMSKAQNALTFWKDYNTLQWGSSGPGRDMTIEVAFIAQAPELTETTQEFSFIPYAHRDLINWSAAVILSLEADQTPTRSWVDRRDDLREQLELALSKGKPLTTNVPRIQNQRTRRLL